MRLPGLSDASASASPRVGQLAGRRQPQEPILRDRSAALGGHLPPATVLSSLRATEQERPVNDTTRREDPSTDHDVLTGAAPRLLRRRTLLHRRSLLLGAAG